AAAVMSPTRTSTTRKRPRDRRRISRGSPSCRKTRTACKSRLELSSQTGSSVACHRLGLRPARFGAKGNAPPQRSAFHLDRARHAIEKGASRLLSRCVDSNRLLVLQVVQ